MGTRSRNAGLGRQFEILPAAAPPLFFTGVRWSGGRVSLSKYEKICRHCNEPFFPELRNRTRQHFCYKPECRKARKVKSHQLWLANNPDHFKGAANVLRVQRWREAHPGYWRRVKAKAKSGLLPDVSPVTRSKNHHPQSMPALQDHVLPLQDSIRRNPLIVGLVAHVFGCTLQDSVEKVIGELIIRGMELRARMHGAKTISRKSAKYDAQKTRASRKPAPVTGAGQMACSPPGAR